jgi:glucose-1-phosphate adenylyltransferase
LRVFAFPFSGYWVDVGTVRSYWESQMALLTSPPPINLNDRSWIIHTRTEERPPVWIARGAQVNDSLITDGCVLEPGCVVECSVLSPGVRVEAGAVVRQSVILTESVVKAGAVLERAILDKRCVVHENARVGRIEEGVEPRIAMLGKHSEVPAGYEIGPGAEIGTDVIASDYPSRVVAAGEKIFTKRLAYEV